MAFPSSIVPEGDMVPLEQEISCVRNIRKETISERNLMRYTVDFVKESAWDPRHRDPDYTQQLELMHEAARRHVARNNQLFSTLQTGNTALQRAIDRAKERNAKELIDLLEEIQSNFHIPRPI